MFFVMNTKFKEFVDWCDGPKKAAQRLQCSESLVFHILNGRRNVTRETANRIHEVSNGRFDRAEMFFGSSTAA